MAKIKAHNLRQQTRSDLLVKLDNLRGELHDLRVAQVNKGAPSKLSKIGVVRKSIARVLTVFSQITKEKLRAKAEKDGFVPKELRQKKTRAIRRRLTKEQSAKKTVKATKKVQNFPMRKYALSA